MSPVRPPIKIITNAVDLITDLATSGPLSPAEAAEHIGIPRSSTYRLIDGLSAVGLLDALADGKVQLSAGWLQLAAGARAALTEWEGADKVLHKLVDLTGQTSFLSVLDGDSAVCVEWCRGPGIEVLALKPGRALPLHAGASGRVLLAYAVDVEAYLASAPFGRLTAATLTQADELRADVELTRRRGYVLAEQDVSGGIDGIGVPIHSDGEVTGCVSINGLTRAFSGHVDEFSAHLAAAATELGYLRHR